MRLSVESVAAPLARPFQAAWGAVGDRKLVLVSLTGDDGVVGIGEAAPLPGYDGVSHDDVLAGIEACRPVLEMAGDDDAAALRARCAERALVPQALAAVDLALWDLAGRRAGRPVWALLGAAAAHAVPVNYTVGASDRAGAAREAADARARGFGTVKVKAGVGDDAGRVAAVRAVAGPAMAIRLDANGTWSVPEAQAHLRALAPAGIELCEEPVSGVEALARLAGRVDVDVAVDETAADPAVFERRLCTAVCLKVARYGGITGVLEAAARARRVGYELYLASTLDGPLGIAAALHAAAAIGPERPSGLATLDVFARGAQGFPVVDGRLAPPPGPGLGDGLAEWYR